MPARIDEGDVAGFESVGFGMCPKCVRMCPEKGNVSGFNYNLKRNVSGIGKINVSEMCPEFSDFGFFFPSEWAVPKWIIYRHNQCSRWF